jgi:zinc/manganese transport system substrate-binding protein
VYVSNISQALQAARPEQADAIAGRAAALDAELVALDNEIKALMSAIPEDRRTVVTSHEAFAYFGDSYGLTFLAPQGLSTDSQPSASQVAELIRQLRDIDNPAVFLEKSSDERLVRRIAEETTSRVGGTLYPEALSEADGPAASYVDMMRHNATLIANALSAAK